MKSIHLLLLIALTASMPLLAQERPKQQRDAQTGAQAGATEQATRQQQPGTEQQQGTDPRQSTESRKTTDQEGTRRGFVDEDGDGINDRAGQGMRGGTNNGDNQPLRERRRDRFVDTDGDGIHDERGGGTGIRKGRRHGAVKGGGQ